MHTLLFVATRCVGRKRRRFFSATAVVAGSCCCCNYVIYTETVVRVSVCVDQHDWVCVANAVWRKRASRVCRARKIVSSGLFPNALFFFASAVLRPPYPLSLS